LKYFIIAAGYNCAALAQKCYESLTNLKFSGEWEAVLISDGSTDGTNEYLESLINKNPKIKIRVDEVNRGAAYQRYHAIHSANLNEEDVIILIGLDDEIFPDALTEIDKHYKAGKWMTYGNWVDQYGKGLPDTFPLDFDEATHRNRDYRKVTYRSTGLNTFKKFLFDQFTEEDFKHKGQWMKATTESNLMFSCLEMCGKDRIGIVHKYICLYNRGRKDNARHRLGSAYQDGIYADVISRPKRNQLFR
jgi:glycosyltransferase involved in cell wall biosynthesis